MTADPAVPRDDHHDARAGNASARGHPVMAQQAITDMDLQARDLTELCGKVDAKVQSLLRMDAARDSALAKVQEQTRVGLEVIAEALTRYRLDELSLSYNGGKDCLVLLILYLSALHTLPAKLPLSLRTVYILSPHPFREVDDFVDSSALTYHLSLSRYAKPMKEAFTDYLADDPAVRAIFVGTRRTDPHGANLRHFDPTDNSWPTFMRIHPVIDWHYQDVWVFIRALGVPYCQLYDMGYTSLGGTTDTHPNPALKAGGEGFKPAYELVADDEERLGRDR